MNEETSDYAVLADEEHCTTTGISTPTLHQSSCLHRWRRENRNVCWILVVVAFAGPSESLGFGAALASYLYISTGESNLKVGYLESAMGITKLLTALPVGDLAGYTYSLFYLSRILS